LLKNNMPELPEVQTTVNYLNSRAHILGARFVDVWSDWYKISKKGIEGKKILKVWRRAKNVIFDLSDEYSLLVHQKMTGHLLVGIWKMSRQGRDPAAAGETWKPAEEGPLNDPYNKFIHLVFFLDNGKMLALSDARKFAKVELWKTDELKKELEKLGPEPLDKSFTFEKFKETLLGSPPSPRLRRVKQVLMDQNVIAGIGNIYSSEILWKAKIHPEKNVANLGQNELKLLYQAIKKVLELAVKLGGESFSDYRKPDGSKGNFDTERNVYRREGQKCHRCGAKIKRLKLGQRSAFFCPHCQKP